MLQTKLSILEDEETIEVIFDLFEMLGWSPMDYQDYTIFEFLQAAMTQPSKSISLGCIAGQSVLGEKMEKIQSHSFYLICRSLKDGQSLEPYDKKTLLNFLKQHFFSHCAIKLQNPQSVSPVDHNAMIIVQRRKNRLP